MRKLTAGHPIWLLILMIVIQSVLGVSVAMAQPPAAQKKPNPNKTANTKPAESGSLKGPIPTGRAKQELEINGIKFDIFTYKPKNYQDGPLFMMFHGVRRNADVYRDNSIEMADRFGAIIVAPCFDEKRFPTRLYQHGGIYNANHDVMSSERWTWAYVPKMIEQIRKQEGKT